MARRRMLTGVVTAVLLFASGCSSGTDATVQGGTFTFVSPGGKLEFGYPADQRGRLPELSGPDLSGAKTVAVSDFPGKIVVINFWGSWCSPCRAEAPALQAASQDLAGHGVQFLGINVKDPQGAGAAFNASKQITYPSIYDFAQRTLFSLRGYPTSSIPSTIVLDRQHRVAHIWLTPVTRGDLVNVVAPLAAEKS